jgi:DNA polymerase III epsilon subunit-like protein
MSNRWCAVDIESTGLTPGVHHPWEVALVTDDGQEFEWLIEDVKLSTAEPKALEVGGFYERWDLHGADKTPAAVVARQVAKHTAGRHLVGVNPAFDAAFLNVLLRHNNRSPAWHYSVIDCKAMAAGWLHGRYAGRDLTDEDGSPAWVSIDLPWRSDELSRWCGVEPPGDDVRHTALADADWAARWYRHLTAPAAVSVPA